MNDERMLVTCNAIQTDHCTNEMCTSNEPHKTHDSTHPKWILVRVCKVVINLGREDVIMIGNTYEG